MVFYDCENRKNHLILFFMTACLSPKVPIVWHNYLKENVYNMERKE